MRQQNCSQLKAIILDSWLASCVGSQALSHVTHWVYQQLCGEKEVESIWPPPQPRPTADANFPWTVRELHAEWIKPPDDCGSGQKLITNFMGARTAQTGHSQIPNPWKPWKMINNNVFKATVFRGDLLSLFRCLVIILDIWILSTFGVDVQILFLSLGSRSKSEKWRSAWLLTYCMKLSCEIKSFIIFSLVERKH